MCIIKFSTQQHNEIYDMTNNLKIIISVRRGELTFFGVFSWNINKNFHEEAINNLGQEII